MAFTEKERAKFEATVSAFIEQRRPPMHIRPQLDFGYRLIGQSVELLETRPVWDDPSRYLDRPFAKITFVRVRDEWQLFWMRASGKWNSYEPCAAGSLRKLLKSIDEDGYGCFFG